MLNWLYLFDTFKFFKLFPFGVRIFVLILAYPGQKFKYDNGAVWGLLQNKRNLINKRKKLGGRGPFQTFLGSFRTRIRMWIRIRVSRQPESTGWPGCRVAWLATPPSPGSSGIPRTELYQCVYLLAVCVGWKSGAHTCKTRWVLLFCSFVRLRMRIFGPIIDSPHRTHTWLALRNLLHFVFV